MLPPAAAPGRVIHPPRQAAAGLGHPRQSALRRPHGDNDKRELRAAFARLARLTLAVAVALELARRFPGASVQSTLPELLFGLSVVNPDSVKQVFGETVFLVLFAVALL